MEQRFKMAAGKVDPLVGAERIRTAVASYVAAPWNGKNESGLVPVDCQVLVLTDMPETKTAGGIELPIESVERIGMAAITGTLAAAGEGAFLWSRSGRPWVGLRPQVGDRVTMQQYSGELRLGRDGLLYRLMDYTNVGGVFEPSAQNDQKKEKAE